MSGQPDSSSRGRESRRSPRRERSPARHKSSRRSRSPVSKSSSRREVSPVKEKQSSRARSPKRAEPSPPLQRSPSPRTKRLRRVQSEREGEKVTSRELEKNGGREREKVRRAHGERESEKDFDKDFEKNGGREREKVRRIHGERESEKEIDKEFGGREREKVRHREKSSDLQASRGRGDRSARDDVSKESSRSRRKRSSSPTDHRRHEHSASPANHRRHGRSQSPSDHHHRSRHRSRSPPRTSKNGRQHEVADSEDAEAYEDGSLAKMKAAEEALDAKKKQQPSFELSGNLAAETNRVKGVTLLFSEPPEARKPDIRWRLYVFKGGEVLNEPLYIHRQSCYLFGRERRVADVPTDHPSCSKQHAVIQFRQVEAEQPDGMLKKIVRPYLMDLGSTNGTYINDVRSEPQRYYELREKDTIKFGNSSREYVMLHENSMDED